MHPGTSLSLLSSLFSLVCVCITGFFFWLLPGLCDGLAAMDGPKMASSSSSSSNCKVLLCSVLVPPFWVLLHSRCPADTRRRRRRREGRYSRIYHPSHSEAIAMTTRRKREKKTKTTTTFPRTSYANTCRNPSFLLYFFACTHTRSINTPRTLKLNSNSRCDIAVKKERKKGEKKAKKRETLCCGVTS